MSVDPSLDSSMMADDEPNSNHQTTTNEEMNTQASEDAVMMQISPTTHTVGDTSPRNKRTYFSAVRERHSNGSAQPMQVEPALDANMVPSSAAYASDAIPSAFIPSSSPYITSNTTSSSPNLTGSLPTSNKRHITSVLNPYSERIRTAPSPPRSPVRGSFGGGSGTSTPTPTSTSSPTSPLRRTVSTPLSGEQAPSTPQRSPIRIGSNAPGATGSPATPTRMGTGHGLPASPRTPTPSRRRRSVGTGSMGSPLLSSRSYVRSPVASFYFPAGVPPSPATRLQHQSTVLQLSLAQPYGCFDDEGITELTTSVVKLPRFCAPYVKRQCLLVQTGNKILSAQAKEARLLRRTQAKQSKLDAERAHHRRQDSDMDSTASAGAALAALAPPTTQKGVEDATPSPGGGRHDLHSPNAGPVRARAMSTCTTASNQTNLEGEQEEGAELSADMDPATFLTPPSISRISESDSVGNDSAQQSAGDRLNVSGWEEKDRTPGGKEEEMEVAENEEHRDQGSDLSTLAEDELILPQTFLYYFTHHLEKFKDETTRFFRVIAGSVDHLVGGEELGSPQFTNPLPNLIISPPPLNSNVNGTHSPVIGHSGTRTPSRSQPGLPPLHIPSPRHALGGANPTPTSSLSPLQAPRAACTASPLHLRREHLEPLMHAILEQHPGLGFLQSTPEFQMKYAQTCIARIFYTLAKAEDRLTLAEVRKSNLLSELRKLEQEDDINASVKYFSYQHFYVAYCSFWELDQPDHDGFLSEENLECYDQRALSQKMVHRIMEDCERRKRRREEKENRRRRRLSGQLNLVDEERNQMEQDSAKSADSSFSADSRASTDDSSHSQHQQSSFDPTTPIMSYEDFIPFFLSEVDKTSPQAIKYWFRLLDVDHDHVLSLYEIDFWFSEQREKIQALSSDTIRTKDIVCQVLDMVKGGERVGVREGVENTIKLPPPALEHLDRKIDGGLVSRSGGRSMNDVGSSLNPFEDSAYHITLKDLLASKQSSYFFNLLFNLHKFLACESRDPIKSRTQHENEERGITEWEAYAAAMYQSLVANEELQARAQEQQQQMDLMQQQQQEQGEEDGLIMHDGERGRDHTEEMEDDTIQPHARVHHKSHHHIQHNRDEELACEEENLMEDDVVDHSRQQQPRRNAPAYTAATLDQDSRDFLRVRFSSGGGVSVHGSVSGTAFFVSDDSDSNSSSSPEAVSDNWKEITPQERRRQEEREYLAMQRKIHSTTPPGEEEDEDEDKSPSNPVAISSFDHATSPTASSRPIRIPSPVASAHSPLQRLHLSSSTEEETSQIDHRVGEDSEASPPSQTYALPTAPRMSFMQMASGLAGGNQTAKSDHQPVMPSEQQFHSPTQQLPGKENDYPLSPTKQPAGGSPGFKRQLQFAPPNKNSPLSPSSLRAMQPQ